MRELDRHFYVRCLGEDLPVTQGPVPAAACPGAGGAHISPPQDDNQNPAEHSPGKGCKNLLFHSCMTVGKIVT